MQNILKYKNIKCKITEFVIQQSFRLKFFLSAILNYDLLHSTLQNKPVLLSHISFTWILKKPAMKTALCIYLFIPLIKLSLLSSIYKLLNDKQHKIKLDFKDKTNFHTQLFSMGLHIRRDKFTCIFVS